LVGYDIDAMVAAFFDRRIERLLREFAPGARLARAWPLAGGISATMTAFEVELRDGAMKRFIARQPASHKFEADRNAAAHEFRVLSALREAGLPVQTPYLLEPPTEEFPEPFFVAEYIEGKPEVAPKDAKGYVRRFTEQLVRIHAVDHASLGLDFLPVQTRGYGERREAPNDSLRETEIRDALESMTPILRSNRPVLRHGDFWPGNILWRDGEVVGVIDWEDALVGEPLADVAICRLDLWWILGQEGAREFTDRYRSLTDFDFRDLPYWDLCASLRPITNIYEWSPAYPQLGRPDISTETMVRDHQQFVEQALSAFHNRF
jgi:aminoglycoside phosphotransferase (APT) family kinase protein